MISGSNDTIDWHLLNRLVDPQYNHTEIRAGNRGAEIGVDPTYAENSMVRLNNQQKTIKDQLIERYEDLNQDARFVADSEECLKKYIIEQYNKNPATYNGVALPLDYSASQHQSQGAREAYFQNPWHSAYRYLVLTLEAKPNGWLHPYAEHLTDSDNSAVRPFRCPKISSEHRALIRAMWVALNDSEFALSPIHTTETAKEELVRTIAALARAHNWDQSRPLMEEYTDENGRKLTRQKMGLVKGQMKYLTEEYDDLELDKPSCVWGVETRLTQFVMLVLKADANEKELKSNDLRDKFREELVGEVPGKNTLFNAIAKMDAATLVKLQDALDEHCIMLTEFAKLSKEQQALLKQIQCYTTQDITQFINNCKAQWGDYRFTQKLTQRVEYQGKQFENYGKLAIHFAQNPLTIFYDAIAERISKQLQILEGKSSAAPVVVVAEDIETLRAQLIELSMRRGDGQFLHYQAADPAIIRQAATQFRAQLARPEQARAAIAEHQAQEEARKNAEAEQARIAAAAEAEKEALRQELIEYAFEHNDQNLVERILNFSMPEIRQERQRQRDEVARLAEAARQAEVARQARQHEEAETEALRQELLNFAFVNNDENLAARIFDYTLPQLRQEQQRQREEAARLAAEQQRLQQEEAVRLAAEQQRQQEEAARRVEAARIIQAQRQAEAARLAAEQQRRQREAAARQATMQQAQPVLLAAYSNARNGQSSNQASAPQVKADIAALFRTVEARQFLAMVNQSEALVKLLNQYTLAAVQTLANGMDSVKLNKITPVNEATKESFLIAFAQRKGLTLEASAQPLRLRVAS